MATGVAVSDPLLASQFMQKELKILRGQFDSLNVGKTGLVSGHELERGLPDLGVAATPEAALALLHDYDKDSKGGLSFEDYLRMKLDLQKGKSPKVSPRSSLTDATSQMLRAAASTSHHQINESEKKAFINHINSSLGSEPALSKVLPLDPTSDDIFSAVKDGVLLCKLINAAVPGTIDERALNTKDTLNPWERNENLTLCLNSAKAIGCSLVNVGTEDITAGRKYIIMGLLAQIIKIQLLATVNVKARPELTEMLEEGEEIADLVNLPAEKVLLRWMNHTLRKADYHKEVTNLTHDIKDSEAYTRLLHQLAPAQCSLSPLELEDLTARAAALLAQAERVLPRKYLQPKDIVEGQPTLNLAFVAHVFHTRSGLKPVVVQEDPELAQELAKLMTDADFQADAREEASFRMWINGLGIETYVSNLFEDVTDGCVLLQALDKLSPGSVNWKTVNKPPLKMPFKRIENCNKVIDACRQMGFSLVGIGGNDIVQGNKKLILALLWQLMRQNTMQLLKSLRSAGGGGELADSDIIAWANETVRAAGKSGTMESFKDKSLGTGCFFLELLTAVEPRVVDQSMVKRGMTAEEKELNAKYIISVARKMGCSIFVLWDDIVEVRPKMTMVLTASIMLHSLSKKKHKRTVSAMP